MWDLLIKTPILNTLFLFYHLLFNNMGLAIIGLTLCVRFVLVPLTLPAMRSSKKLKEIKPQLDKLKKEHGKDQAAFASAQMQLYRDHGINPVGGCLPILLSIPIMIALYQVLLQVLDIGSVEMLNEKMYFDFLKISDLSQIKTSFLWLDLAKPDQFFILPILVAASQFINSMVMSASNPPSSADKGDKASKGQESKPSTEDFSEIMQTQTKYLLPLMSLFITLRLPSGVALYWLVSTAFGIIQQKILA